MGNQKMVIKFLKLTPLLPDQGDVPLQDQGHQYNQKTMVNLLIKFPKITLVFPLGDAERQNPHLDQIFKINLLRTLLKLALVLPCEEKIGLEANRPKRILKLKLLFLQTRLSENFINIKQLIFLLI